MSKIVSPHELAAALVSLSISDRILLRDAAKRLMTLNDVIDQFLAPRFRTLDDQALFHVRQWMLTETIKGRTPADARDHVVARINAMLDDAVAVVRGEKENGL